MIKTNLILLFTFLVNGFLNAQVIDSMKCECDSILKSKIESGIMFAFAGRTVKSLIKPDNNTCEIGKFSIDILVNQNGDVIHAELDTKISDKISDKLKAVLTDAALKSKFMDKNDAPSKQKGNITYVYRMKDKN